MNAQKANNTKEKVGKLQRKLYLAAKSNSKRRFHALYDKVYRKDILIEAWKRVRANGGVGGIDRVTFADIEVYGVETFLLEIQNELKEGKYHPKPVKRTYIPKGKDQRRPLGIPVIKDRVIQMAVKIAIEPIFEADIKGYFDNINHEKLMLLVKQRISDRRILKMICKWLRAGVMEKGEIYSSLIGSPQGGVISPLLSNIYLHYLDIKWERHYTHLGKLVRYCDDFVIISRTKKEAEHALKAVNYIMGRLELELHPDKTKLVNMWDGKEGFDFLGFHHRRKTTETSKGQRFQETHQSPSPKAMQKMRDNIKRVFASRSTLLLDVQDMIKILNPKITGMRNYYGLKNAGIQLNKMDWYIIKKFTLWYNYKTQNRRRYARISNVREIIYQNGLKKLVG